MFIIEANLERTGYVNIKHYFNSSLTGSNYSKFSYQQVVYLPDVYRSIKKLESKNLSNINKFELMNLLEQAILALEETINNESKKLSTWKGYSDKLAKKSNALLDQLRVVKRSPESLREAYDELYAELEIYQSNTNVLKIIDEITRF